jgi:hypothetical protein
MDELKLKDKEIIENKLFYFLNKKAKHSVS